VAGVITALATLYAVHVASASPESIPEPAEPAPEASASVDAGSVATRADSAPAADDAMLSDAATVLLTDCADGLLDSCVTLLHLLVEDCYDGNPYGCDTLYWISPVGSDYEAYGATCGGRFGWEFVGTCSEL
jgi:hypothetical protein